MLNYWGKHITLKGRAHAHQYRASTKDTQWHLWRFFASKLFYPDIFYSLTCPFAFTVFMTFKECLCMMCVCTHISCTFSDAFFCLFSCFILFNFMTII